MSGTSRPAGTPRFEVAIAGAGIAGLSAALSLLDRGRARGVDVALTLFDSAPRAGGVIRTERQDGFLIEAGPDCFITDKPWAVQLCRRLRLDGELIGTNPDSRRSYILRGRRLVPVPEGFNLMAPARLLPFVTTSALSLRGKLRAGWDLFLPRGSQAADESLAGFVRRRFGDEVLERLAQPLVAGIYNADPERLSLRATLPRFLDLERDHRSVILGLMRRHRRPGGAGEAPKADGAAVGGASGARYSLFAAPRRGMESMVERLVQELPGDALRLSTAVTGIAAAPREPGGDDERRGWIVTTSRGDRLRFHALILALPADIGAGLLRPIDAGVAKALAEIRYGGTTTVSLAYRDADLRHVPDGFGFVVPRSENRRLMACSFSSIKFAGRAPDGMTLLRAFIPEAIPDGAEEETLAAVRGELREILRVDAAPLVQRVFSYPGAMAQYDLGHLERIADIESHLERHTGLALAGNGLRGVGVPDCIRSGEAAADRLLSQAPHLMA